MATYQLQLTRLDAAGARSGLPVPWTSGPTYDSPDELPTAVEAYVAWRAERAVAAAARFPGMPAQPATIATDVDGIGWRIDVAGASSWVATLGPSRTARAEEVPYQEAAAEVREAEAVADAEALGQAPPTESEPT